jgi:hypothetical protein
MEGIYSSWLNCSDVDFTKPFCIFWRNPMYIHFKEPIACCTDHKKKVQMDRVIDKEDPNSYDYSCPVCGSSFTIEFPIEVNEVPQCK